MEENKTVKINNKAVIVTAVITAAVIIAVSTVLVFFCFGDAIKFQKDYPKLVELADVIDRQYIGEYDSGDLAEAAAYEMVTATGDRWSYYLSARELEEYTMSLSNSYVGIGITVSKNAGEYMKIESVEPSGGAEQAGISPGDVIIAVDSQNIIDMTTDEVKTLISGDEGSCVELTIQRDGETKNFSVERRKLKVASISYELVGTTGYVKIKNFFDNTAEDFIAAVDDMIAQGADSFVFDVRFNGGGYLHELIDMLDYLLPEGVIFRSEDIKGNTFEEKSDENCIELPLAVLVNDMTFSAAEYFAEAIREFEWGVVVGSRTSGKGYSQNLIYLSDGSAVNLSTMKYFTPDGTCLTGVGITPDIELNTDEEERIGVYYGSIDPKEDSQLQAAFEAVQVKQPDIIER